MKKKLYILLVPVLLVAIIVGFVAWTTKNRSETSATQDIINGQAEVIEETINKQETSTKEVTNATKEDKSEALDTLVDDSESVVENDAHTHDENCNHDVSLGESKISDTTALKAFIKERALAVYEVKNGSEITYQFEDGTKLETYDHPVDFLSFIDESGVIYCEVASSFQVVNPEGDPDAFAVLKEEDFLETVIFQNNINLQN